MSRSGREEEVQKTHTHVRPRNVACFGANAEFWKNRHLTFTGGGDPTGGVGSAFVSSEQTKIPFHFETRPCGTPVLGCGNRWLSGQLFAKPRGLVSEVVVIP